MWAWAAQQYGDAPAVQDLKRTLQVRLTFRELWEQVSLAALGGCGGRRTSSRLAKVQGESGVLVSREAACPGWAG